VQRRPSVAAQRIHDGTGKLAGAGGRRAVDADADPSRSGGGDDQLHQRLPVDGTNLHAKMIS
jgi:hypothetical protein